MRTHRFLSSFLALAAFALSMMPALSQARGPEVPCTGVDCAQVPLFDTPASGFWGAPEENGIAIHMFIQNKVMFGMYYGYTETGAPIWYLFTDRFERPEEAPGLLRANATLEQYANGSCIGCAFSQPEQVDLPGTIELTFDQRNHGTYRIDGGEAIHIVPLEINSAVAYEFASEMRYALPDPEGPWALTFKTEPVDYGYGHIRTFAGVFRPKTVGTFANGDVASMRWDFAASTAESAPVLANLTCSAYDGGSPPGRIPVECTLAIYDSEGQFPQLGDGVWFPLPYANITGGRIVSKDPDTGIRLEAFRIGYD